MRVRGSCSNCRDSPRHPRARSRAAWMRSAMPPPPRTTRATVRCGSSSSPRVTSLAAAQPRARPAESLCRPVARLTCRWINRPRPGAGGVIAGIGSEQGFLPLAASPSGLPVQAASCQQDPGCACGKLHATRGVKLGVATAGSVRHMARYSNNPCRKRALSGHGVCIAARPMVIKRSAHAGHSNSGD